ncbi:MAG: hypothetical protein AABX82_01705, partial [Nanoarchaeota archaeon]
MELWIVEVLKEQNRVSVSILFGDHAAKDKNLTEDDVDCVVDTVRRGKIDVFKSTEETKRVCFKNYYKEKGITYFVITEFYPSFI